MAASPRHHVLTMRVTPEEHRAIRVAAALNGESISAWGVRILLDFAHREVEHFREEAPGADDDALKRDWA